MRSVPIANIRAISLALTIAIVPTALFCQTMKSIDRIETNGVSTRSKRAAIDLNADRTLRVIELRNYLVRPGRRDEFVDLFEANFTRSQNELGGYTLGQYRVKGAKDNFFWIRGFADMPARTKFLNDFYRHAPAWLQHRNAANSMLLNNDNVHLLKPLDLTGDSIKANEGFDSNWFGQARGVAVVDLYTSNTKLEKLIQFVKRDYDPLWHSSNVGSTSYWVSELTANDFPALPVFQDPNLLVQISFYKNETEYRAKLKYLDSKMTDAFRTEMADLVTVKETLIIYPTKRSFRLPKR